MSDQTPYNTDGKKKLVPMAVEFVENPEPRCACVLLLDCSSSMDPRNYGQQVNIEQINIEQLNMGVREFKKELEKDDIASKRVEIAIVKFSDTAEVVTDFTNVDEFDPPILKAEGVTNMTDAINLAANMLEERKNDYKQNGIAYYRPWMFMITDGEPTDENGHPLSDSDHRLTDTIKTLHNGVNGKKFTFFAVGVDNANMHTLSKLSPKFPPKRLRENKWSEMFEWLSSSMVSMASSSMDQERVKLRSTSNWDYADL